MQGLAFKDKESYYATGLHELTHWPKAKHWLDRDFSAKRFGDHGYRRRDYGFRSQAKGVSSPRQWNSDELSCGCILLVSA
jgi:antirestriction protein ArdC